MLGSVSALPVGIVPDPGEDKVLMLYDDNLFSLVSNLLSLRQKDLCRDLQFISKVDRKEHYVLLTRCWPSTWD